MAYQKTNWATGDVVTADKLNNIENGIVNVGNRGTVYLFSHTIHEGNNTYAVLNITFNELAAGLGLDIEGGLGNFYYLIDFIGEEIHSLYTFMPLKTIMVNATPGEEEFTVIFENFGDSIIFSATDPDGPLRALIDDGSENPK